MKFRTLKHLICERIKCSKKWLISLVLTYIVITFRTLHKYIGAHLIVRFVHEK